MGPGRPPTDGAPDDDFMPAFTRWKREHFESGFLELRRRGGGGEVSGIALSTEGAGDARTTEDFNGFQLLFRNVPAPTLFVRG